MIYTIGYQSSGLAQIHQALVIKKVTTLIDVRSDPYSKANALFNEPVLKDYFGKGKLNTVKYLWGGVKLGGRGEIVPGAVKWLSEQGKKENLCLMCVEKNPLECHRHWKIAKMLFEEFDTKAIHLMIHQSKTVFLDLQTLGEVTAETFVKPKKVQQELI